MRRGYCAHNGSCGAGVTGCVSTEPGKPTTRGMRVLWVGWMGGDQYQAVFARSRP